MAVSDGTVLLAFMLIDRVDILVKLTGKITVSSAVKMDMQEALGSLAPGTEWPGEEQVEVAFTDVTTPVLRLSEDETLQLATQRGARVILSDDPVVRATARQKDLKVLGTPGILYAASRKGLIDDISSVLDTLERKAYTFGPMVHEELEQRTG